MCRVPRLLPTLQLFVIRRRTRGIRRRSVPWGYELILVLDEWGARMFYHLWRGGLCAFLACLTWKETFADPCFVGHCSWQSVLSKQFVVNWLVSLMRVYTGLRVGIITISVIQFNQRLQHIRDHPLSPLSPLLAFNWRDSAWEWDSLTALTIMGVINSQNNNT